MRTEKKSANEDQAAKAGKWKSYFVPLAESGDPSAQIALGWEYAKGKYFPQDLGMAEYWFRKAYESGGDERAVLHLINVLIRKKPEEVDRVYLENPNWSLGGIDLAYALHKLRGGMPDADVMEILERAAQKGNLLAEIKLHTLRNKGARRIINILTEIRLGFRAIRIGMRNKEDLRIIY